MKTLEMMNKAELDGRTYKYKDIHYSKINGFTDYNGKEWDNDNAFSTPNNLLILDGWKVTSELSDAERVILGSVESEWKWIARDSNSEWLYLFTCEPIKSSNSDEWTADGEVMNLKAFAHLFQFIQWSDSEPRLIAELLEV